MIMRVLICGDRNWTNQEMIEDKLAFLISIVYSPLDILVIQGEARGADSLARLAAESLNIPVIKFPAQWDLYGRAAGPIRNKQMLEEGKPDMVLAFHDNIQASKGTKYMVMLARKAYIPDVVVCHP